ncbi:MAG: CopD family protein [Burkholderiales bacterium]|nr:CopD family protein [Burkholderiales bacterium]
MRIALLVHLLGAIIWIGGMFFAYVALRPAAARLLEPPQRLPLWREALGRFFTWVWVSIAALFTTGFHMLADAYGVKAVPLYVLAMAAIASAMTLIFVYVYFIPFKALSAAVGGSDWRAGGRALNTIRRLVATNLLLGFATLVVAVIGGLLA